MTRGDLTPATHDERRALADVAETPAWKWVTQVYKSSGLAVDLLDEHLTLLTIPGRGASARGVEQQIAEAIRTLAASVADGERKSAVVAGRRFYGVPIMSAGVFAGAVLIGTDGERGRDVEVQSAIALLTRALDDFLSPDDEHRTTASRLNALHGLLDEASSTASEQHVFRAFAEIVNVWDDVEVLGYRGDLAGRFALTGALPGTDRSSIPDVIATEGLPSDAVMTLPTAMQKQLGFRESKYPLLVRLSTAGGPWLIALTQRQGNQQFAEWFDFYVAALTTSLNASLEVELARTTWGIMQHLAENDSPREAVTKAILGVAQSLPADATFAIWEPDGALALSIGEPTSAGVGDVGRAPNVLRTRIDAPGGRHALLEMRAALGHQFTRRDVKVFEAAAWTLSRWFSTAAGQLAIVPGNAAAAQSFDEVIERYLRARERSWSPALILIMPTSADASTDLAYEWIRGLRSELRPTDLAGRLTTGEVAVVLVETTPAGAFAVAQRIARVFSESSDPAQKRVRVGLAAGDHVSTSAQGLIAEARQHVVDG